MTTRSLAPNSARAGLRARAHRFATAFIALAVCALLSACTGILAPEAGSYRATIPAVLQKADIGVLRALAGSQTNGLSRHVAVHVFINRDTVTASQLLEVVSIVVPLIDQPGTDSLQLRFHEADPISPENADFIDITDARYELLTDWGEAAPEYGDGAVGLFSESISMLRRHLADGSPKRQSLGRGHR